MKRRYPAYDVHGATGGERDRRRRGCGCAKRLPMLGSREASLEMDGGRGPTMWRRCAGTLRMAAAGQTDRQTDEYEYEYKGEDFDAEKVVACTAGCGR